jgi:hypothetical protein
MAKSLVLFVLLTFLGFAPIFDYSACPYLTVA